MTGSLYDHAVVLHGQFPDSPFSRDGSPYPDEERYRRPDDHRTEGIDVAAALDALRADCNRVRP
ncbi:hypothetical protein SK571_38830 [Lentzea sp. BCCO 10_0798]|uniref:Uncharacterized protein n=1 Tax=Lentzea kristufekii TaxID=3095430 RepID=A0ABU4U521_9PSEU|nr:hypothetical protein [Lentzea sp. BCCO 10_0798]MDX8055364.1 hypothetical protein [Lentzea sp. BCCO 10_0798]